MLVAARTYGSLCGRYPPSRKPYPENEVGRHMIAREKAERGSHALAGARVAYPDQLSRLERPGAYVQEMG